MTTTSQEPLKDIAATPEDEDRLILAEALEVWAKNSLSPGRLQAEEPLSPQADVSTFVPLPAPPCPTAVIRDSGRPFVSQEQLETFLRLRDASYQYGSARNEIAAALEADAEIEEGPLDAKLEIKFRPHLTVDFLVQEGVVSNEQVEACSERCPSQRRRYISVYRGRTILHPSSSTEGSRESTRVVGP